MRAGLDFTGRLNVFTNITQLQASSLEVGQMVKITDTGEEYRVMGNTVTQGIKLANDNRAVKLSELIREFNTLTDLKACPNLQLGEKCRTWGNELLGDSGASDYVIAEQGSSALLKGDVDLGNGIVARQVLRDNSHLEKVNHIVVTKGTTVVNTGMVNLSKNPKVFLDGLLLIPGEHYTITNSSKGIIELARAFTRDVNIMVVDSILYSTSDGIGSSERYNVFTLPKNTTTVNSGLTKLTVRPTLIINGVYLILGKHWNISNAATGEIVVVEPYTEDAECIIIDNNISGVVDAATLSGITRDNFTKCEEDINTLTANIEKYNVGDIIAIMKPDLHYREVSTTSGRDPIQIGELFLNYHWTEEQFVATNITHLQESKRFDLGHIVHVLGNQTKGDGFAHYRKKVANSSSTSVPALDGSNHHWEIVPNTMIADKANTGGSNLSIKDLDTNKANKSIKIKGGNGLSGEGTLNSDVTLQIQTISPALVATAAGLDLTVINDFVTGGVKVPASAESVKVLKQLIDSIGTGGVMRLLRTGDTFASTDKLGTLTAGGTTIVVGKTLYEPVLYLDGVRISSDMYNVELVSGLITLNTPYSKTYDCIWVVEDGYPNHIKFAFPTLNLLIASAEVKALINLGDVIEILGEGDADDGDHRLVKCENIKKLNGVDIGSGKWLNEIPNTRIKTISDKSNLNRRDITNIVGGTGANGGEREYSFIQDAGQKVAGKFYLDRNTNGIYKCVRTTNSVNNDSSFVKVDLDATLDKLQNLVKSNYDTDANFYIDIGRVRIYRGRITIPKETKQAIVTLPFSYTNTNYVVIGIHDYARSNSAVYNIEVDASYNRTVNSFALTSNSTDNNNNTSAGFICIGLI